MKELHTHTHTHTHLLILNDVYEKKLKFVNFVSGFKCIRKYKNKIKPVLGYG